MIQTPPPPPQAPKPFNAGATPAVNNRRGMFILVALFALFVLWRLFSHHQTANEALAYRLTASLQANDLAAVQKDVNAQTRLVIDRATVGKAADAFAPLGKLKSVKENTPPGGDPHVHTFVANFDKGTVNEKLGLDADGKVFRFHYDQPIMKK